MTAKLFIDGDERELHYVDMDYNRITSFIGWPVSEIFGGLIHLRFTPRGDEDFFLNWMFAQRDLEYPRCLYTFKNGEVVFYEGDVTEDIFFKYRFADCILIRYKETFSNQWGMETEMVLSPAIQYYNHKSKYPFLKRWNESYVPPSEQTPYQPIEITDEFYVSIKHLTDKEAFVPLGIPAFDGTSENQYIEFEMEIMENDIDDFIIEFLHDNKVVQSYISGSQTLDEVVVKGKGSGKASNTNTSNNSKSASNYPVGKFKIQWDGFDGNGVYDSTVFTTGKFKARIKAKRQGKEKSAETGEFSFDKKIKWVDTKINKNSKRIDVTLRVNLKDGGAKGLSDWDDIPKKDLIVDKPPLKTQTKSFKDLEKLALEGLNYHWGRNKNHFIAKNVDINEEHYEVFVNAVNTTENAMDDVSLIFNTNRKWMRSGNPGTVDDPISAIGNLVSREAVCYNVGYIEYSYGWDFQIYKNEDITFKETSAHEIGHTILKAFGGTFYSYGHKGTVNTITQSENNNATNYPNRGEIDIMPYYKNWIPYSQRNKMVAATKDVLSLIWLTKIKLK